MQKLPIQKFWILILPITFPLPVLNYPYLGILKRVDLKFLHDKIGKNRPREIEIIRKSNFANDNFPIKIVWATKFQMPITCLYFKMERIWTKFEITTLPQNFSPWTSSLSLQIWWVTSTSWGLPVLPFRGSPEFMVGELQAPKIG